VDQLTKEKLKHDQFIDTTKHGLEWASDNRKQVVTAVLAALGVIVVAVIVIVLVNYRSGKAAVAFGEAMQTYQAPLTTPGEPAAPGVKTYNSPKERAQAANAQFLDVARHYGMTTYGKNALYFAGLSYLEAGQTSSAEATLKKVADGWDRQLASLAKEALADLYHQSGRDAQAIELYQQLTHHPTDAVPAGLAQIELAELYASEGKTEQANKIYAQLKDKDKTAKGTPGPAGALAAQKLNPAPSGGPQIQ
jgi:tetratricopeptide (TPR) repeat protein